MPAGSTTLTLPPDLRPEDHALFLDLDGTLFEIEERPELVAPDEGVTALLSPLNRRVAGALAVLTGRCAEDADRILENTVDMIAGLHGQEWLIGGALLRAPEQVGLANARTVLTDLVEKGTLDARIEDKGGGLALHYRHAPDQAPVVTHAVQQVAKMHGLRALHGKLVSELTPQGATKGSAIITLMQRPPFVGRTPVAIGDDVTDEDAFAAVNELGGFSILVGARRESVATYSLPNVGAVRAWLSKGLEM